MAMHSAQAKPIACKFAPSPIHKLVSLFEPHADITIKGGRDVHYANKLNLTTGRSGLILDLVIEAGNPAGSERLLPMLERQIGIWDQTPRQAADGGYASREKSAAGQGPRLKAEDMVKCKWVYRKVGVSLCSSTAAPGTVAPFTAHHQKAINLIGDRKSSEPRTRCDYLRCAPV